MPNGIMDRFFKQLKPKGKPRMSGEDKYITK